MNEQGLSQMQPQGMQSNPQEEQAEMIQQVMQMLMQGATPKQLMQQGVPKEVIMQAMEMLKQMGPQSAPQPDPAMSGLAGMQMPQGNI